jgi:hypothetical protein
MRCPLPKILQMKPIVIKEEIFDYDYKDFERWRNGDKKFLLNKTGYLNKKSYDGQPSHNFSEVRYAYQLITKEGFTKENIICENYRLSFSAIKNDLEKGKDNLHTRGTNDLCKVFSDQFFDEFDRLYEFNKDKVKKPRERVYVDLCAINHNEKLVKFCEIKRVNSNGKRVDELNLSQKFCLFFVRYAIDTLDKKAFKNGTSYYVESRIIVLVPNNFSLMFKPREYVLRFLVPR